MREGSRRRRAAAGYGAAFATGTLTAVGALLIAVVLVLRPAAGAA